MMRLTLLPVPRLIVLQENRVEVLDGYRATAHDTSDSPDSPSNWLGARRTVTPGFLSGGRVRRSMLRQVWSLHSEQADLDYLAERRPHHMTEVVSGAKRSHEYELGHSDRELKRPGTQAALVDPITRLFFQIAGNGAGMRVLDVGSGAGDVAFLAAELVGPTGEVVGTDRSLPAVAAAAEGAKTRGLQNVAFVLGDPSTLSLGRPFDAVVGRYVLMFSDDPVKMLKGIAAHIRPGGIMAFHEADWSGVRSTPPAPIYDRCCSWIAETFRKVGTNPNMGLGLHSAFIAAGLPAPTMGLQALAGGGYSDVCGINLIANLAITMAPVMEETGVTAVAELGPGNLEGRMRSEVLANGSVVVGRSEVGAWTRTISREA